MTLEALPATDHRNAFAESTDPFSAMAISADGSTAAYSDSTQDDGVGAVWVFGDSGGSWTLQAKLGPPATSEHLLFGSQLAMTPDGDTMVIGGATAGGTVWVYRRVGTSWKESGEVAAPAGFTIFGASLALSGDGRTLVIGGNAGSASASSLLLYAQSGDRWVEQDQLPSLSPGSSVVGIDLSRDGNTAIVCSLARDSNRLGCTVDRRSGTSWIQQPLTLDHLPFIALGAGLADDGSTVAVNTVVAKHTELLVFARGTSGWGAPQELDPVGIDPAAVVYRAFALSRTGSVAYGAGTSAKHGYIWGFARGASSRWSEQSETPLPAGAGTPVGMALSADASQLLVTTSSGAALVYTVHGTAGAPAKLTLKLDAPRSVDVVKNRELTFAVAASMPGRLSTSLLRGSKVVATNTTSIHENVPTSVSLRLPRTLAVGVYRLSVNATAGERHATTAADIRVLRSASG